MKTAPCPDCGSVREYNSLTLRGSIRGILCNQCGKVFWPEPTKRGVTVNQRRSRDQEKRAAKRYGGRVQPASGALRGAKGDFRDRGRTRGECKFTLARSFSLKLAELLKLKGEARGGEKALFEIEFQSVYPHERFVVLSEDDYQMLLGGKK